MGYANSTHMYYRHYLEAPNSTYNITVTPLLGNPVLIVGINSTGELYPTLYSYNSY